jgi:hypothetical protein
MGDAGTSSALTENLLATIRLQRHLGARILISTQEPTISPKLLDLCSVTVVHRFTSPDWLSALRKHLAGLSSSSKLLQQAQDLAAIRATSSSGITSNGITKSIVGIKGISLDSENPALELFAKIVSLRVGEALVFSPSAIIGVDKVALDSSLKSIGVNSISLDGASSNVHRLGNGVLKVRIRSRVTADGGRSIMAS